ncbi:hypothetical protein CEXT_13391 [Caerostris extrusa]|uniref:Uncharacterized protein n=1 Tax=Caerostris extrusa TaxID=172846 RepID=A0AAV4YAT5_CAEEX|nr:hypothetical protein CEXT_13391 [Caerostris extrusa]
MNQCLQTLRLRIPFRLTVKRIGPILVALTSKPKVAGVGRTRRPDAFLLRQVDENGSWEWPTQMGSTIRSSRRLWNTVMSITICVGVQPHRWTVLQLSAAFHLANIEKKTFLINVCITTR